MCIVFFETIETSISMQIFFPLSFFPSANIFARRKQLFSFINALRSSVIPPFFCPYRSKLPATFIAVQIYLLYSNFLHFLWFFICKYICPIFFPYCNNICTVLFVQKLGYVSHFFSPFAASCAYRVAAPCCNDICYAIIFAFHFIFSASEQTKAELAQQSTRLSLSFLFFLLRFVWRRCHRLGINMPAFEPML